MIVSVEVRATGKSEPPAGSPVIVQVQDTSLIDVEARVLGEARTTVEEVRDRALAVVEVEVTETSPRMTVWAHVDVDRDGRVSKGDYITMQSYPVTRGETATVSVTVKRV